MTLYRYSATYAYPTDRPGPVPGSCGRPAGGWHRARRPRRHHVFREMRLALGRRLSGQGTGLFLGAMRPIGRQGVSDLEDWPLSVGAEDLFQGCADLAERRLGPGGGHDVRHQGGAFVLAAFLSDARAALTAP